MKKYLTLFLIFTTLTIFFAGCGENSKRDDGKFLIVTSFYPLYIDAINIVDGIDGVEVKNMTKPQTGCLHDYQLTTEDMTTLESADVFIVNGLGMENFLQKVIDEQKGLKIVNASDYEHIVPIMDGDEPNPHVWTSITYSIDQVKAITSQLCEIDPDHAKEYRDNAMKYVTELSDLRNTMHFELDALPNKDIVTFHEAFPYFAAEFKLNLVGVIEREPGTEPTPKELEETIEKINSLPVKVLFTEPQYSSKAADTIARETGAKIFTLDPIVTGEATPDQKSAYIDKMRENMNVLKEALGN